MQPPRVPDELATLVDPGRDDGTAWDRVEVRGRAGGPAEVVDVEIVSSRLVGLRLTGRELINLHLLDVILEDCELSGAMIRNARLTRVELRRCRLSGLAAGGLKGRDVLVDDCKASSAESLRGVVIGSDQVMPLALALFSALHVTDDDDLPGREQIPLR